ncbi:MAG: helix-turn-helix transcriptional regulator [Oscillospiraceae bacterium]|nr:helix-turn-helix transcriptional regulator [Oscillospiraceae bacterium]
MLVTNMHIVGNRLYEIRKRAGLTRAEVAERANLSDRTYADIERGSSNMRAETLIGICNALHITPDEIFVDTNAALDVQQEEIFNRLSECSAKERETALKLIEVYLHSLNK